MSLTTTIKFINKHPLAKRHKLKAFSRFFKWQISQMIHPHPVAYPFIGTTKLWVQKGMTGATGNIYTGLHDFEDMGFLLHFLRPEDLFIDIGANIGSYSILASGVTKASSISIEPIPQTFVALEKNISINGLLEKITALNIGLGSKKGTLLFTECYDTINHVVLNKDQQQDGKLIKVPVDSLDEIIIGKQVPVLLKIDVEGFEQEVINGANELFSNTVLKAIIIELNGSGGRYGYDESKIHEQLLEYGFSSYLYNPFNRSLEKVERFGNFNTIYLRDIDFIKNRLKTSDGFTVFFEHI